MNRENPSFIPELDNDALLWNYNWDEWDPYTLLGEIDESTLNKLSEISNRGVVVFSLGCAEWVIYHLASHLPDDRAFLYLDACWALVLGEPIALPQDPTSREWQGKMLSTAGMSIINVINTWRMSEDGEADSHAGLAEQVSLHILTNTDNFIKWRDAALKRLAKYHPYSEKHDDCLGPIVAREVLDPVINLEGVNQNLLAKQYLSRLHLKNNPYVIYT